MITLRLEFRAKTSYGLGIKPVASTQAIPTAGGTETHLACQHQTAFINGTINN